MTVRRYPYLRCNGDKNRVCVLCSAPYIVKNPEEIDAFCSACFSKERKHEIRKVYQNVWRAEQANQTATLTIKQWLTILDHFDWKCAYCSDGKYEVLEHIVSITKGGGTTALNCIPACNSCNKRKDSMTYGYISLSLISQIREQLEKIATALGVEPGDLLVSDKKYRAMTEPSEEDAA